jgi:hypothetical protein
MTTSIKDARSLLAVKLGDGQPLVPEDARGQGAGAVVAAALKHLAALKLPRAPLLYRSASTRESGAETHQNKSKERLFSND